LGRTVLTLVAIAFVAWTIVLISRRSPFGRWFGSLLLVLILAGLIYVALNPHSPASLPSSDAERAGYLIGYAMGQALAIGLFLVLIWRFGFGRASRAFFGRSHATP